jgi:hypothetical protein
LKDRHWTTIYKIGQNFYEYDSFGRDLLGSEFIDAQTHAEQKNTEGNCGQRTLAHLEKVF